MKNKLLRLPGILLLLALSIPLNAQLQKGVSLGGAYNYFTSSQSHLSGNAGLTVGTIVGMDIGTSLHLKSGVEYLQLGGGYLLFEDNYRYGVDWQEIPYPLKTRDVRVTLHTINIPVRVSYFLINSGSSSLSVGAGPEVSFLLGAYSNETITALSSFGPDAVYVTYTQKNYEFDNYNVVNIAGTLGVNFAIPMGTNTVQMDARYRYGLNPLRKGFSYLDYSGIKDNLIQNSIIITVAYLF